MIGKNAAVSVICPEDEYKKTYSFLEKEFTRVTRFAPGASLETEAELSSSNIVFIDGYFRESAVHILLEALSKALQPPKVFFVWDSEHMLLPDSLARVFYFFKKPFKKRTMLKVIKQALTAEIPVENRREIRFDKKAEVELCYEEKAFLTQTTNLSLHGMQAVWPTDDYIDEISARLYNNEKSISECFLYMNDIFGPKIDNLYLNVDLRYIQNSRGKTLMGFEFENLDTETMEKIYRLISA